MAIPQVRLTVLPPVPCPYLPGRMETVQAVMASAIDGNTYRAFLEAGFRRSGRMIYQPVCENCRACISLRVPVEIFKPSASQRRCLRRNSDLTITHAAPRLSSEKIDLYARYVREWHGRKEDDAIDSLESFLYDSPTDTIEFEYRDASNRLLAIGICDVSASSLSSVYFYFDPAEARRGLGTFGSLKEIVWASERGIGFYYLGYWIGDCPAMSYKANFRPHELLSVTGAWLRAEI